MRSIYRLMAAQLAAVSLAACIGSTAVGPTSTGASIAGLVKTAGSSMSGLQVSVPSALVSTTTDSNGRFALNGIPAGAVVLSFQGNTVNASLAIGTVSEGQQISIVVNVNGSAAALESMETRAANQMEVEGVIGSLSGGCPNLTFVLNGKTVKTNSATKFDEISCGRLANGMRVEVKGTTASDGSILATRVETDDDEDDDRQDGEREVEGRISGLSGSCPSLTFIVGSTTVKTSSGTQFKNVACSALANGTEVEAEGTLSNNVLAATKIEKK